MVEACEPRTRSPRKLSARSRGRLERLKRDQKAWSLTVRVAITRRVSLRDLLHGARNQGNVALSRQLAMYLVHVLLSRTQQEVGFLFSRSRTTVTYACRNIEMLRDDPVFDEEVQRIEAQIWSYGRQPTTELLHAA